MQESFPSAPAEGVAAYVGMDWADQRHDVILRTASEPGKPSTDALLTSPML